MTVYNDKKDETLVELTLLGDEKAFEELVIRHERSVKGTAYKVTGNEYSAEDASQDAFVTAWIKLDALREREKFGSWVCTIAKNRAKDLVIHYKNAAADISLDLLENTEVTSSDISGLADMLSLEKLCEEERDKRLHEAVEELSEKIRETVILHYFEGMSVTDISQKLGIPEGTVKWRLNEGRKQLRKEYGIMDKKYINDETFVKRVMQQVEELKLWALKNDKKGFEEEYRAVLKNIEQLDDSKEKDHALADVLLRGYWWLPGERNDETFEKIKQAAEKSKNEDVMQVIVCHEHDKYKGKERTDYMRNVQIPRLEKDGFVKTLAYVWFWLGKHYLDDNETEKGLEAYRKVTDILTEKDIYYGLALSAIECENKTRRLGIPKNDYSINATGESIKRIGDKLYFWEQPGYSDGWMPLNNESLFWNMHCCDGLLYDPGMKCGDTVTASDGGTLTYEKQGQRVETPAGTFENCSVYVFRGNKFTYRLTYCESWFCPGVGLVMQKVTRFGETNLWKLSDYNVADNNDMIPLNKGNRWEYTTNFDDGMLHNLSSVFEVTYSDESTAIMRHHCIDYISGYMEDTCRGNLVKARREYVKNISESGERLSDVSEYLSKAASLAKTSREKTHSKVADKVMKRIFDTDPDFNPNYTQKGIWNFFCYFEAKTENGRIEIGDNRTYSFEWKDVPIKPGEGFKLLYNFMIELMQDTINCVWSDEWVPGYTFKGERQEFGNDITLDFEVSEDKEVTVKAGTFTDCRHIVFNLTGKKGGWSYRAGRTEFWYAEGIGVIKLLKYYNSDKESCVWELTDYIGTGDGYFPIRDGLFRRYEPKDITGGWNGYTEYTYLVDESGCVIFADQAGLRDRENYLADKTDK